MNNELCAQKTASYMNSSTQWQYEGPFMHRYPFKRRITESQVSQQTEKKEKTPNFFFSLFLVYFLMKEETKDNNVTKDKVNTSV